MMNRHLVRMRSLRFSSLDFKLGVRMLARYPGLTLVATAALAVAIALSIIYFEGLDKFLNPRLPIRNGDAVVSVRSVEIAGRGREARLLHDFAIWREQVRTVADLGAAIVFVRNLITEDGRAEPVRGAEVTASAFKLMRTPPLMGRVLTEQDERPAEPPVVVISHSLWDARFERDPGVVGRTVRLGTVPVTIVGVMPEGFAFPRVERIWAPLRLNGALLAPRTGPPVSVFGVLAPGASMTGAQAEFDIIGAQLAASYPETHKNLRPLVTTYEGPYGEAMVLGTIMYAVNSIFLILLSVVSLNVATLVFARTAARGWDITVRSALGATRGRIVMQLFIEALVLTAVAAVLGLILARVAMSWGLGQMTAGDGLPFWIDASLSWKTVIYTVLLALFGAQIVGVLPALRLTRTNVQDALRNEGEARAGLRFGGFWTGVIVMQVAIVVAFLPLAIGGIYASNRFQQRAEAIDADRYVTAAVDMDPEDYAADSGVFAARARRSFDELERRIAAEPAVEHVTFADPLPVTDQAKYPIELDGTTSAPATGLRTSTAVKVSPGYFAAFDTSVVAGRDFVPLDFENGRVLIVNQSFAHYVFGDRNPVGQRIRILAGEDADPGLVSGDDWYEIVGMIRDFGWQLPRPQEQSAMYRPRLPTPGAGMRLVVRARDPGAVAARVQSLAVDVDPTIRLTEVQSLARVGGGEETMNRTLTAVAWLLASMVLLLSATGIYSLTAFTVARRTREIGIRTVLGARPGRIVAGIFSRAFLQIGAGILAGTGLAAVLGLGRGSTGRQVLLLLAADGIMFVVGLAACALPLRRALRIDPTEALRMEGQSVRGR